MVQNIFRSSLVHRVIILICRSHWLPHAASDQTVAESHPDAFPDVHLDLVVILKKIHLVILLHIFLLHYRVWRGDNIVELLEELGVHQLRLLQVVPL